MFSVRAVVFLVILFSPFVVFAQIPIQKNPDQKNKKSNKKVEKKCKDFKEFKAAIKCFQRKHTDDLEDTPNVFAVPAWNPIEPQPDNRI